MKILDIFRRVFSSTYTAAALLVLISISIFMHDAGTVHLGQEVYRYGFLGVISAAVMTAYIPQLIRYIRLGYYGQNMGFVLGIVLTWGGNAIIRIWYWIWLLKHRPEWMLNHFIPNLAVVVVVLGAVVHLFTVLGWDRPPAAGRLVFVSVALLAALTVLVLTPVIYGG